MTKPSIVDSVPAAGALWGATISVASLKRLASSSTLNSCVLVCWYSSPGSGSGASMDVATP